MLWQRRHNSCACWTTACWHYTVLCSPDIAQHSRRQNEKEGSPRQVSWVDKETPNKTQQLCWDITHGCRVGAQKRRCWSSSAVFIPLQLVNAVNYSDNCELNSYSGECWYVCLFAGTRAANVAVAVDAASVVVIVNKEVLNIKFNLRKTFVH